MDEDDEQVHGLVGLVLRQYKTSEDGNFDSGFDEIKFLLLQPCEDGAGGRVYERLTVMQKVIFWEQGDLNKRQGVTEKRIVRLR